jgi:hypothetical protein
VESPLSEIWRENETRQNSRQLRPRHIRPSAVVHPYTFGLVGVSPVTLPYTPVSIFCTRLRQKTPTQKIFLSMHVYSTIPSTVQYLTIK